MRAPEHDDPTPPDPEPDLEALRRYLLSASQACIRPPIDRFRHPWIAPMPPSRATAELLDARRTRQDPPPTPTARSMRIPDSGDGFVSGDYSLGLFHHDASESAIELVHHPDLREAAFGSLLCFLDCAEPNGLIHRTELPHKARDAEPAKPVMAQLAWRVVSACGETGRERAVRHRVLPRILAFLEWLEQHTMGLHGLFTTPSSRASGFDNDILTAGLPDGTVEGPDTNAFMVLEYEAAARLARHLGEEVRADELLEKADALRERMNRLTWYEDERGGMYVALRWRHGVGSLAGEVVGLRDGVGPERPAESWTCLLPLYAGIPSPTRAEAMIRRLLDPETYWGPMGVRTLSKRDPFFHQAPRALLWDPRKQTRGPVSNWMGPVWVLSSYYLAVGLARYGYRGPARDLAWRTARMLARDLAETGALHESYDDQGRGLWPRQGTFVSWNVLALTLLRELASDVDPAGEVTTGAR